MKACLRSISACLFLAIVLLGCRPGAIPDTDRPRVAIAHAPDEQKPDDKELADLPAVIGVKEEAKYGPHIAIWVNGDPYVDATLRDSEDVTADQLGNYLSRITFSSTKKVRIKADEGDAKKARLKAKFDLSLSDHRRKLVLRMSFNEMRLAQSGSDPKAWLLTAEGIELIEKAIPKDD